MTGYETRFAGVGSLLGNESLERLKNAHFLVIGLGGVGTWAVESLVRSGLGKLTLVDLDDICVSNTNRQLHAHEGNYGKMKAEALAERVKLINPECEVEIILSYFNKKNADEILSKKYSMVVDGIDSIDEKTILLNLCYRKGLKVVTAGAAGGKTDPTKITVAEITKTKQDKLIKAIKKKLRREFNYPLGNGKAKVKCVYSFEPSKKIKTCDVTNSTKLDCSGGLGTSTYMTGTFGFLLSYIAIDEFLKTKTS
ncbi:MAG: hypothetical protein BM556_09260 [Bacteriovorax sp. MedPE-SWde]|nr:MAG: hypothetical protein BM556_09260 [Bacteriovorax sp. MedPE-SWde]